MTEPRASSRGARALGALVVAVLVALWPAAATAHTDFDGSTPEDGVVVEGPLDEIAVRFTNPAVPTGEGFVVLDAAGSVVEPASLDATDGTTFVLTFDPPLEAGPYGVRWQVRAGDAHPIDGSFRFQVADPVEAQPGAGTSSTTLAPAVVDDSPPSDSAATLDELLGMDDSVDDARAVGRFGRSVTFIGTIVAVGVVAALVWVVRGRRDEITAQLGWVRLAGLAIAVGGVVELAALHSIDASDPIGLAGTRAGLAAVLKTIGGLAVCIGFHPATGRIEVPPRSVSAAVADLGDLDGGARGSAIPHRWVPTATSALGLAGLAAVLVSFWFDGHTVTEGPWALHAVVNLVHVGAAAVWGGGVFAMTAVVWMRRRASDPTGLGPMVVRFSSVATVSLLAVTAAGLAMAAMIVDDPGDLVSTTWGRVLLAKVAVVAVAGSMGAYNHVRVRPALESDPNDPGSIAMLRRTLTIESTAFVGIALLTAWLVASAV